jgi:hypothetical protein
VPMLQHALRDTSIRSHWPNTRVWSVSCGEDNPGISVRRFSVGLFRICACEARILLACRAPRYYQISSGYHLLRRVSQCQQSRQRLWKAPAVALRSPMCVASTQSRSSINDEAEYSDGAKTHDDVLMEHQARVSPVAYYNRRQCARQPYSLTPSPRNACCKARNVRHKTTT